MDFYTNVTNFGNTVLVRGVKNGQRVSERHKLAPTLFVPSKKPTNFKTLDDKYLIPVKHQSISEAKDFVEKSIKKIINKFFFTLILLFCLHDSPYLPHLLLPWYL